MSKYLNMLAVITALLALTVNHSATTALASPLFPPPPPQIAPQGLKEDRDLSTIIQKRRRNKSHVPPARKWLSGIEIAAKAAGGHIIFVDNAMHINPTSTAWPQEKVHALASFYDQAVENGYASRRGFGSLSQWATASGVSIEKPVLVIYDREHALGIQPTVRWYDTIPVITYGKVIRTQIPFHSIQMATHELAHIWDAVYDWELGAGITTIVQNPDNYPTAKACNEGAHEDFAESVTAYLWPGYAANVRWADDDLRFIEQYGEQADAVWTLDRHDYVARLFRSETVDAIRMTEESTIQTGDEGEKPDIFSDTPDVPVP